MGAVLRRMRGTALWEDAPISSRTTVIPTSRGPRPSGTTTIAWTSLARRSTRASRDYTSCATRSRTRCLCRGREGGAACDRRPHLQRGWFPLLPVLGSILNGRARHPRARHQRDDWRYDAGEWVPLTLPGGLGHPLPLQDTQRVERPVLRPDARPASAGRQALRSGRQRRWAAR